MQGVRELRVFLGRERAVWMEDQAWEGMGLVVTAYTVLISTFKWDRLTWVALI